MTESNNEHMSKYAKKHVTNKSIVANPVIETEEQTAISESNNSNDIVNKNNIHKNNKTKDRFEIINKYPKHITDLVLIIKDNAEIRRFTSLGILNYLLQKGEIKNEHKYVTYKWNKFVVKSSGLIREFSYAEPFFVKCLIASFTSFSASAQKIINVFCNEELKEKLDEITSNTDIEEIVKSTEKYQEEKESNVVEKE